jgi:hypothetical protein
MSKTKIPQAAVLEVWLRAGGRCEYPQCNAALWRDDITLTQMNRAYLAHIIADSPKGPRGDQVLSAQLAKDPSNIMLLCDAHHRLVDKTDIEGYPAELLRRYKAEHEDRIERQTGIQTNLRTELLLFGTKIKERSGLVNSADARDAVLPNRYPASESGIPIDLADIDMAEDDPEFWTVVPKIVERTLSRFLHEGVGPTGRPINHLSVFALAPIPLLIHFGKCLGDTIPADVFQRHRGGSPWHWGALEEEGFDYSTFTPDPAEKQGDRIALNLSLSGVIHDTEIGRALGERVPTYTMTIARPRRDFLRAKEQLELFRREWYALLGRIRGAHGEDCEIHLFPAIPVAVAVEIGRSLLPKADPRIVVYDADKEHGGFRPTLTL